jgi:hypothetical protein
VQIEAEKENASARRRDHVPQLSTLGTSILISHILDENKSKIIFEERQTPFQESI